jgi:hypothetical protein
MEREEGFYWVYTAAVNALGGKVDIQRTGSSEWQRGFIVVNGTTIGRASIKHGELSHVKWYLFRSGTIDAREYHMDYVDYFLSTGKRLTKGVWDFYCEQARRLHLKDLEQKKAWRRANPYTGKGHRKPLAGKSERAFLNELLYSPSVQSDWDRYYQWLKLNANCGE